MAALEAGQLLTATLLNDKLRKRVARGRRTTNSSNITSGTYVSVLRLDDIPLKAGRAYDIIWKAHFTVATATDVLGVLLFYTTDGSTPTTSSSVLPGSSGQVDFASTAQTPVATVIADYNPVVDETLSVLLAANHVVGTSNSNVTANGIGFVTSLYVDDKGDDPGDTGTDL